jgi:septal ring factor EnvC (AmiA/AmiB activator)
MSVTKVTLPLKEILQLEKVWRDVADSAAKKQANRDRRAALESAGSRVISSVKKSLVPQLDNNQQQSTTTNNNDNNNQKYDAIDANLAAEVQRLEAELKSVVNAVREKREAVPHELHAQMRKKVRLMYSTDRFYESDDIEPTSPVVSFGFFVIFFFFCL